MKAPKTLAAKYMALLRAEGYRPALDRSVEKLPTIVFKSEGVTFILFVDEDDEQFFHLGIGFALDPATDYPATTARAQELTATLKAVKVTVHPEEQAIRYHVEAFTEAPASMAVIERSIAALRNAGREFHEPATEPRRLDA